jgi:hypothetical protein
MTNWCIGKNGPASCAGSDFEDEEIMRRIFFALALCGLPAFAASAQTAQKSATLDTYRQKAMLPSICQQLGGKLTYGQQTPQCELPKVVTGATASSPTTIGRPPPVSTRK